MRGPGSRTGLHVVRCLGLSTVRVALSRVIPWVGPGGARRGTTALAVRFDPCDGLNNPPPPRSTRTPSLESLGAGPGAAPRGRSSARLTQYRDASPVDAHLSQILDPAPFARSPTPGQPITPIPRVEDPLLNRRTGVHTRKSQPAHSLSPMGGRCKLPPPSPCNSYGNPKLIRSLRLP